MTRIKAKIIGNQVWTTENLSRLEYQQLTGRKLPVKNDRWSEYDGPKCFAYDSVVKHKKEYLFDLNALRYLRECTTGWRIPDTNDLDILFRTIDENASFYWNTENLPQELRGAYGWLNNGTNKIGFNAYPNPTLDENGLQEFEISRWWYHNEHLSLYAGFGIYENDVLAVSGPLYENIGLAIRLVMDLTIPRIEENIYYV